MRTFIYASLSAVLVALTGCSGITASDVVATTHTTQSTTERTLVLADGAVARIGRASPDLLGGGMAMLTPTPGVEPYACEAFGTWEGDWLDAFAGVTDHRQSRYLHQQVGSVLVYPGAHVANGSNTNSLTYLGACNGDYLDDLTVTIERRVNGSWNPVFTITVQSFERLIFQSGIPAQYRARTEGAFGANIEHYGVGAAWNATRLVKRTR